MPLSVVYGSQSYICLVKSPRQYPPREVCRKEVLPSAARVRTIPGLSGGRK